MRSLLDRIQTGIGAGAALATGIAGVGCASSELRPFAKYDAGADATVQPSDSGTDAVTHVDAGHLVSYPLEGLGWDPNTSCEYWPECYVRVGGRPCGEVDDPNLPLSLYSYGECEATGPFAPNPLDTMYAPVGDCCYINASLILEGRPLLVAQTIVVAAVHARADWTA